MSKLKRSEGMIYLGANFMPDCSLGHFQIDDVLNLFFRGNANLGIRSDGYSVFFSLKHHFTSRPQRKGLGWLKHG